MYEMEVNMDYLTAISYTKAPKPPWDVRKLVKKVKEYMDMMHTIKLGHCYREGNKLADALVGLMATETEMETELTQVLIMLSDIICNDDSGKLYERE